MNYQDALAVCVASIKERKVKSRVSYTLFYSNQMHRYDGKLTGNSARKLAAEFLLTRAGYNYALIFEDGKDKPVAAYSKELRNSFVWMNRIKKK